jgi:DNA-binding CsgD family transcriptional regulator
VLELTLGRHERARSLARTALRLVRTTGVPTLEIAPLGFLGLADFLAGDWDGAERAASELLSLGHRVGSGRAVVFGLTVRALVLAHRGNLASAAACLAEARAGFGERLGADHHAFSLIETIESMVALERGDPARALAAVEGRATSWLIVPPFQLAMLGEAQVAAGQPDAALATAAQIARLDSEAPYLAALAARLTGLAAHQRGDPATARRELRLAAEGFGQLAIPFEIARCQLAWARAAAMEHPAEAVAAAQESLIILTTLGARRFADQARGLLRTLGARPAPPRRRGPPAGGLSQREAEVVRLVAEGLSNAEIGRRLVISPRTVTTHLQHVYARLGISSRVVLVRYATDHLLLDQPVGDTTDS